MTKQALTTVALLLLSVAACDHYNVPLFDTVLILLGFLAAFLAVVLWERFE